MKKITISIQDQTLTLCSEEGDFIKTFPISSAEKGINCQKNSGGTPTGLHVIRAKIGENAPMNSVFVGRRLTGEIWNTELQQAFPNRDWILSRILWLSGLEEGVNRLGQVDTMQRYIYIHGTPDTEPMGVPLSHGCIRMRNQDVIELFETVTAGTEVMIL